MKPLVTIPNYATSSHDLDMLETCLSTLRKTVGDACDVLVVDDGSPAQDVAKACGALAERFDADWHPKPVNEGYSKAINIGLRRALNEERDAITVNADIEFFTATWLDLMLKQKRSDRDELASVVGGLLLFPNNTIQHAGVYFSLLYRCFDHIYRYGPHNLPEARHARVCPVTGALQFIRYECLAEVGVYDETFRLGWEDVDYCVRTWQSGRQCIYQPGVRAYHHESFFRGGSRQNDRIAKWTAMSWARFREKWADTNFAEFVPSLHFTADPPSPVT